MKDNNRNTYDSIESGVTLADEEEPLNVQISSDGKSYEAIASAQENHGTKEVGVIKVYKRRWYILAVFSAVAIMNGYFCFIWSVTAASAEAAFGWTDHDISTILNWQPITYIAAVVPFCWITTAAGFRPAVVTCAALVTLGSISRCISFAPPLVTWLANVGQVCNGLAGPLSFAGGLVLSTTWFPPGERATATAIATIISYLGNSLCFIIGPAVIKEDTARSANVSNLEINTIKQDLKILRYTETGIAGVILIAVICYFPSRPPLPPSLSAASKQDQIPFPKAIRKLFCSDNRSYWLLAVSFAIFGGIPSAWAALMDVIFKPLGVSQKEAGWFGFYGGLPGCFAAFIVGRLADCLTGRMKPLLLILMTGGILATFAILLEANAYLPLYKAMVYMGSVVAGICINAALPLSIELAVESCFPVPAAVASGVMTVMFQIPIVAILFISSMPGYNLGTNWITWCQYLGSVAAFPLTLVAKEQYKRLQIDSGSIKHTLPEVKEEDENKPLLSL